MCLDLALICPDTSSDGVWPTCCHTCLTLQFNPELKKKDMKDITVNNVASKHWDCGGKSFPLIGFGSFCFPYALCLHSFSISTSMWAHKIHVCWETWLGPPLFEEPAAPAPLPQDSGMSPLRLGLWVHTGSSCNISENEARELCYGKSSTTSTRQSITAYRPITFHILTDMPMGFRALV